MEVDQIKEDVEIEKPDHEVEAVSSSSNEDSDEDADADADMEESPRGRKSVSSIIAEMAIKNEQEMASNNSRAKTQKEDEQKRLGKLSNDSLKKICNIWKKNVRTKHAKIRKNQ